MASEFRVGRTGGPTGLRAGAALALVLAAGGVAPAIAQSALEQPASEPIGAAPSADEDPQAARTAEGQTGGQERDRVYVLGRKVSSSIATLPSVEDAPQVINVISGETLAEQGVTSLEQALRNVPGITTQIGEGGVMNGDQFFIRGLAAKNDIYTDGLRDFGVYTRDSFNYGQVEVLKGPSATTLGRGTAGGGINTTSKTPYLENGASITLAGGSAEYARATGDWNQVIGAGMAVRLNAMVHQNEVEGRDLIRSERWGVAPSIGFGLDGATSFTLAALYQEDDRVPDYGLPTATPTVNGPGFPVTDFGVPSSNFYGYEADTDQTEVFTVTARLRHEVNDDLVLTSDTKYGNYVRYFQQTPVSCPAPTIANPVTCSTMLADGDPATVPMVSIGGPGPYDQTTDGVQNVSTLSYTGPLGGFRNEFLAGWDVSWQTNDRDQFNYSPARAPKDLFNPAHTPNPTLAAIRNNVRDSTAKDVSIFVTDRFWFTEQWSVSAGVRAQWYEMDQNTTAFNVTSCRGVTGVFPTCYTPLSSNSEFVTPRVSVIFEPTMSQSYYVSYSTSATPPGITVSNGSLIGAPGSGNSIGTSDLDPEENESIEAGAKFQLFRDRLLVQGAVFQVKKTNAKEVDPLSDNIIRSGDSQEVAGFELGAAGAVTDQWSINANYTYLDTETTDCSPPNNSPPGTVCANIGNRIAFTPEHAASLWTTYNFLGALAGLEVGAGVTYQGDVALSSANTAFAPEYTSLDALISYGWDRYRLSLNAYNLTDELYFAQVHGNRVVPAAGRNFIATLGVVF